MSVLIKSGPDVDSAKSVSRYFLRYQQDAIECADRMQVTEKANRIGFTYMDAFLNVRKRLHHKRRDYLFTTQNWAGAVEYSRYLDHFISIFNLSKSLISRTEETVNVTDDKGVARQEKIGTYNFDTGSRIVLFSSNPWSIQTFEGDVGWDETAFHDAQEKMYTALITRITWGYDLAAWSAHNGMGSWFNQVLLKLAKAQGSGWTHRKITIYDAIADGLVEKINERGGKQMTREEFLADCRKRALTPAIFAERFECNPADAGSSIVPWGIIEKSRNVPQIIRHHMSDAEVKTLFGLSTDSGPRRLALMQDWLLKQFGALKHGKEKIRFGFDVAASGQGDLGSFWLDAKVGGRLEQRALLTTQTEDWNFLTAALNWFMEELPDARGAGDKTGLGRQICWQAEQAFPGRFVGVPFTAPGKSALGTRLMNQLTAGERGLPVGEADVAMDLFSLQKSVRSGQVAFDAVQNPLNAASHCDMAWSAALSGEADASTLAPCAPPHRFADIGSLGRAVQSRRERSIIG